VTVLPDLFYNSLLLGGLLMSVHSVGGQAAPPPQALPCKDDVIDAIREDEIEFEDVDLALRGDREVVSAALQKDFSNLEFASIDIQGDQKFLLDTIEKTQEAEACRDALNPDENFSGNSFLFLDYVTPELKDDNNFVLKAVKLDGMNLHFASNRLRNDPEVVDAAAVQSDYTFQYASEPLRSSKDFVLSLVARQGRAIKHASEELRNDKEVALAAVSSYPPILREVSARLQDDIDVVLAAVQKDGLSLMFASDALRNTKDVVLAAVRSRGYALSHASQDLRNNDEVVEAAVEKSALALQFASLRLRRSPKYC